MTKHLATFAGGCFWCVEAVFQMVDGVTDVTPGFTGGGESSPSYYDVAYGRTAHVEAVQFTYDDALVSYGELLQVFFETHDPTTKDRQGPDVGPMYRSAIFWHDAEQRDLARQFICDLQIHLAPREITTELLEATRFHRAEEAHINFYQKNRSLPYCIINIIPKLRKLEGLRGDR
jgi:peptide-methionine (S)-S-oxide reductase